MRKTVLLAFIGIVMTLAFSGKLFAGETDLLIKKLVEKDVLTPFEAQILKETTLVKRLIKPVLKQLVAPLKKTSA